MSNKSKILIVEDEVNIRSFTGTILETNGYQVLCAENCTQAELMFSSHHPDLVVLDLGLPDRDGLDFISTARCLSSIPIIVLSARTMENDKISALDLGANDYITKPFGTGELLARIRAVLRSTRHANELSATPGGKFVSSDLVVDYDRRLVKIDDRNIKLTHTEYNIIVLLTEHVGRVMTYSAIICEIWGDMDPGSIKKLQVNMANIRKKLGVKPGEHKYLANEIGAGYRMLDDE